MSIQQQINNEIIQKLSNKFDDIILEGLSLKGILFGSKKEAEEFIKLNCRCEDNIQHKQKIFYVNNIPFLLHNYEMIINKFEEPFKLVADWGCYKFL